jgi:translation initiation factor IF-3
MRVAAGVALIDSLTRPFGRATIRTARSPQPRRLLSSTDYRVNRQIRIPEVRLIDQNGAQVGILPTAEAQRMADQAGLDLVEVSPTARPPVCRILDFGKFKYAQRKKEKGSHAKASGLKELRVRPAIDEHDLSYRLDQGRKFLKEGHKVQVVCIFRGRQMAHPEHGYQVMQKVAESLGDISKIEMTPKLMGKRMTMLLAAK